MAEEQNPQEGGYRELLRVSYPLILSTASSTVMQFVNRVFLAHYSPDALAACVPGGMLSFTFLCFFMGTASYTNAFVSQYHGKGKTASVSVAMWQGILLALAASLVLVALTPAGLYVIDHSGHPAAVRALERPYFTILNLFAVLPVVNTALAAFFIGRGRTKTTLFVNLAGNAFCVLASWLLIFGAGPLPAGGIAGAAWASVLAQALMTALYASLIFSAYNRRRYRTLRLAGAHGDMFARLVKYGAPNGVGFFLDVASFGVFIFLVGGMDEASLAANNIIASINSIAFMPIIGLGLATLTLVGKYIGMGKPDVSVRVAYRAVRLALCYAALIGASFALLPGMYINIFGSGDAAAYADILAKSRPVMRVLAVFVLFDAFGMIFADALRGAGDTRFQMLGASAAAWGLFVPGTWYIVHHAGGELIHAWAWGLVYVMLLAVFFSLRFRSGLWRKIDILKG